MSIASSRNGRQIARERDPRAREVALEVVARMLFVILVVMIVCNNESKLGLFRAKGAKQHEQGSGTSSLLAQDSSGPAVGRSIDKSARVAAPAPAHRHMASRFGRDYPAQNRYGLGKRVKCAMLASRIDVELVS